MFSSSPEMKQEASMPNPKEVVKLTSMKKLDETGKLSSRSRLDEAARPSCIPVGEESPGSALSRSRGR